VISSAPTNSLNRAEWQGNRFLHFGERHITRSEIEQAMAKDPVCGMEVNEKTAKFRYEYGGKTYYFCCEHCLNQFKANPAKYV